MTTIRSLAAILAADVAGYFRLIGIDEAGTLGRLRTIQQYSLASRVAREGRTGGYACCAAGSGPPSRSTSRSGCISTAPIAPPNSITRPQIEKPVLKPASGVAAFSMMLPIT